MAGKDYARGMLLALLWCGLLITGLYAAALFAPKAWNMRGFILALAAVWPLLAGFLAGWPEGGKGGGGFVAALRWVGPPLLLLAGLWWWLFPQLWRGALYGKFALYAAVAALLCGGLSAGIAKARQALYPPRPEDKEENEEEDEEEK